MLDLIRSRMREERGFTLIELLVVMIIVAILMAVAVPVFLGQKQKALATNAKTNAKNVYDAIESCGASTTNGTLIDTAGSGINCTTADTVKANEPSLSKLFDAGSCGTVPCVEIVPGSGEAYTIRSRTAGGQADQVTFELARTASTVTKKCTGNGTGEALKRMCPTGVW